MMKTVELYASILTPEEMATLARECREIAGVCTDGSGLASAQTCRHVRAALVHLAQELDHEAARKAIRSTIEACEENEGTVLS